MAESHHGNQIFKGGFFKMKRNVISMLAATSMVATLALTGCGGSKEAATTAAPAETKAAETTAAVTEAASVTEAAKEVKETEAAAGNAGGLINVGFAQVGHESDWRTASTKSCQDVFSEANGYNLSFVDCDNDSAAQLEAVRSFIEQDVDYIIIDPIVSTGWDTVLTECEDAAIPVIVIDRTIDDSDKYTAWVGSDFTKEGKAAGEWLKAYADKKDKYGFKILDEQTGDFTEDGGQQVMESYCKSYAGKFNVVVCQNDNEAFGAMTAMDNAGISYGPNGDVVLISFDSCTAGLEDVKAEKITADFECNPLAAPFVEQVIQQLQKGETPDKEVYMEEHWFALPDAIVDFSVDGEAQTMTEVTDAVIEAQY